MGPRLAADMIPVVVAGGGGERLWPLSREDSPKQFLPLACESSLFQQALERVAVFSGRSPLVICNEEHRFVAAEQLRQLGTQATILLEPVGRNTAPAIALAAFQAVKREAPVIYRIHPDVGNYSLVCFDGDQAREALGEDRCFSRQLALISLFKRRLSLSLVFPGSTWLSRRAHNS